MHPLTLRFASELERAYAEDAFPRVWTYLLVGRSPDSPPLEVPAPALEVPANSVQSEALSTIVSRPGPRNTEGCLGTHT